MDAVRVFRRTARREPTRTFAFDTTAAVTYADADARSDAIASDLMSREVAAGQPIGLCAPDSLDLLLSILGAWKAGALPSLIDARTSEADLAYFVGNTNAHLVAAHPNLLDGLHRAGAVSLVEIGSLGRRKGNGPNVHGPASPLYLSYTSGTTGQPKGAILRSGPVTLGTACIADRLGLTRQDVLLATTPSSSSFQLVAALLPAIHVGAAVGLVAGLGPSELWAAAHQYEATVLVGYPLTLADMVNAPDAKAASPFRLALSGGLRLAPRIKRDYRDRLGIPLVESYGQSEFGGFMALGSPRDDDRSFAGYVGKSLPDRPTCVMGYDGEELPPDYVGEVVAPYGFFEGYWNNATATAKTLAGGVLHSGDVGKVDADGYLMVVGRTNEMAAAKRRGGFLRELEDTLYEHPSVVHAAAIAPDDDRIDAFVELQNGQVISGDEIIAFAAERVPAGLRPSRLRVLEQMPRTFSGKPDRRRLAVQYGATG